MIYSFTVASTLARLMGLGSFWILVSAVLAAVLDIIIDSGHKSCKRSAVTHSIASVPVPFLTTLFIIWFVPLIDLDFIVTIFIRVGLILSISFLGHLFWDSLTVNGIHVPGVGWVSLAHLESRGAAANIIPILFTVIIISLFW